ncbi:hypothetical protein ZIOFF_036871 [Zingiber officinale]|uniref:aldehyde oxygenase (deformylating) n=1 Tax=Zingiber officinale TaxID=94328 RepID=A0A8J5L3R0_ZINOF|nr:hypothetical protein ZIOFF_036871 [Zingiber officinale]
MRRWEAEVALGRSLTFAEDIWFRYTAWMPDYLLFYHNIIFLFVIFSLAPLSLALIELGFPASDWASPSLTVGSGFATLGLLRGGGLWQLLDSPTNALRGYEKIHRVHHEFTATIGFATPYAHWAEVLLLGIPSFAGPAMVPCHMITFWLWIALRQLEAIETHSGYRSHHTSFL